MSYFVKFITRVVVLALSLCVFFPSFKTDAAIEFNKNFLISDNLFIASGSMSVEQIQDFFDANGSLLANWVDNVDMRRPSDNCVVHKATGMTAAEIIYEAATAWNAQIVENCSGTSVSYWGDADYSNYTMPTVSPKVLLVTLQKEQSLISANGTYSTDPNAYKNPPCCSSNEYKLARATGYGVPDSGSINEQYLGFYNQINWASWQLRYNFERAGGNTDWDEVGYKVFTGPFIEGTWKRCGTCSPELFDGYYTIDGAPLYMENRATASLYYYTPHTYPGYYGNYNFVQFYNNWFGNPYASVSYAYDLVSIEAYTDSARTQAYTKTRLSMAPGSKAYLRVTTRNTGSIQWDNSTLKLGTANPIDRTSVFYDSSWNSASRVTNMVEPSVNYYQTASFEFELTAPTQSGTYTEMFGVVVEGIKWMLDDPIALTIDVTDTVTATSTNNTLPSGAILYPNDYLLSPDRHSVLVLQPDNRLVLRNDFKSVFQTSNSSVVGTTRLIMQSDGNLVLYDSNNSAKWHTGTFGNPGAYLSLNTDGRMVVYSSGGSTELWASNTKVNPDFLSQVEWQLTGVLYPGQQLQTADRQHRLVYQSDGNIVLYSPTKAIWAIYKLTDQPGYLAMQSDGNLVAYRKDGTPYWSSYTNRNSGAILQLLGDRLEITSITGKILWETKKEVQASENSSQSTLPSGKTLGKGQKLQSGNKKYSLVFQSDGNLVLYGPSGYLWATHKYSSSPKHVAMQSDGNLVTYNNGSKPYWHSKTFSNPGSYLAVQNDGNVVIYNQSNKPIWHTGTNQ